MTDTSVQPAISFGPRIRKSPYFAATRRYGCKAYTVYNHTYMPLYYESPEADFWRLVRDVTLWDVSCQRQVEITGPDAARFAQLLTSRNLSSCAVGQCKYVLITDEDGGIVNDPVLLRLAEDRFWLSLSDSDVLLWAKGVARHAGLDVTLCEPDVSPLQVQGPKSSALMRDLFGAWIDELRYFWCRESELDGIPLVVSRTGWSSERGYEVYLRDGAQGDRLWELIMAAGLPHEIAPGAPSGIRRIEGAMLSYGSDITLAENPFELGLGRLVDLDMEADYVGKAALRRIAAEGVTRRLVGLEIGGPPLPAGNEEPWPLRAAGAAAGRLTSCVYSPRLEKNIGLAIVAIDQAKEGCRLTVEAPDASREATVVPKPFYDPKKTLAAG
jgi:aminomethyltransferase